MAPLSHIDAADLLAFSAGSDNEWTVDYVNSVGAVSCGGNQRAGASKGTPSVPQDRRCVTCEKPLTKRWQKRCCSKSCAARQTPIHPQSGPANGNFKGWISRNRVRYQKRFVARNPEKVSAQRAVADAIRKGKLVRPSLCDSCLKSCKPDAHHPDYSKPLSVEWLCKKCHRAADLAASRLRRSA